jgi:N-acetylglucosamine kinase-like BadF-type ATPase
MTAPPATDAVALAVDGGNSKTDLALVRGDGAVLSVVRGSRSTPHRLGLDGSVDVLQDLLEAAAREAGLGLDGGPVAERAEVLLAGADLPQEERALQEAIARRGWARRVAVANDTFAVLRAGTDAGWGVAIVCGAGINCVGRGRDGREVRFPALGAITGDWGGGEEIGLAGLGAAARSADGRGPRTSLERAVPAHFGLGTPPDVAEAIHLKRIPYERVVELAPIVLAAAETDPVAGEIVDRARAEIVALARVAITKLELTREPVEVLLGGGLLRADGGPRLADAAAADLNRIAPRARVRLVDVPPIIGAALLALDELGSNAEAKARLRADLAARVAPFEDGADA